MGVEVVKRKAKPYSNKVVIPKELHKEANSLNLVAKARLCWDLGVLALIPLDIYEGIHQISGPGFGVSDVVGIVMLIMAVVTLVVLISFWESAPSLYNRKEALQLDANRENATHHTIRSTRMQDVHYTQYSLWVDAQGTSLKYVVLMHTKNSKGVWKANKTKIAHNIQSGSYSRDEIASVILVDPTLEEAQETFRVWEEKVEALEEAAYQEAFKIMRVKRLAMLTRAPGKSVKAEAHHLRDEFDGGRHDAALMHGLQEEVKYKPTQLDSDSEHEIVEESW